MIIKLSKQLIRKFEALSEEEQQYVFKEAMKSAVDQMPKFHPREPGEPIPAGLFQGEEL